jgi:hypothetical protein
MLYQTGSDKMHETTGSFALKTGDSVVVFSSYIRVRINPMSDILMLIWNRSSSSFLERVPQLPFLKSQEVTIRGYRRRKLRTYSDHGGRRYWPRKERCLQN